MFPCGMAWEIYDIGYFKNYSLVVKTIIIKKES